MLLALLAVALPARAQLEVLLRGVGPSEPRQGVCGLYRFRAVEPTGSRTIEFRACVESASPDGDGSVVLHLWSGDSLEARVEVAPAMFAGRGGSLLEHVRSVVQVEHGKTARLEPEDWQQLPALSPAPQLPVVADSSLGSATLEIRTDRLECLGRLLEEARSFVRTMGDVEVTAAEHRRLEIWTAAEAPLLGVVRARATVRSERNFSSPIPGVPQRGPRESFYELELLEISADPSAGRAVTGH
ncbi:MAG: hypothetical protein ACE5G2_09425 [Candidatus Krumholzibacteriia bacterium]